MAMAGLVARRTDGSWGRKFWNGNSESASVGAGFRAAGLRWMQVPGVFRGGLIPAVK